MKMNNAMLSKIHNIMLINGKFACRVFLPKNDSFFKSSDGQIKPMFYGCG
jgi:hypothetical protein